MVVPVVVVGISGIVIAAGGIIVVSSVIAVYAVVASLVVVVVVRIGLWAVHQKETIRQKAMECPT